MAGTVERGAASARHGVSWSGATRRAMSHTLAWPGLLLWDQPRRTGAVALTGTAVLLTTLYFSFLTAAAGTGLILLLAGMASKLYVHLMGFLKKPCSDPLLRLEQLPLCVSEEAVVAAVRHHTKILNTALAATRRLVLVHDTLQWAACCILLYCLARLGLHCSTLVLCTLAWLAVFSLPLLYTRHQASCDTAVAALLRHVAALRHSLNSPEKQQATPAKRK